LKEEEEEEEKEEEETVVWRLARPPGRNLGTLP